MRKGVIGLAAFFGTTRDGQTVGMHILQNELGRVQLLDYGCSIQSLVFDGRDLVLGYDDLAGYEQGSMLIGAFVGRCVNRILGGRFRIDERSFQLPKNDGENHIHGIYPKSVFSAEEEENQVTFRRRSPDGEEGYPGTVEIQVRFRLEPPFRLILDVDAEADQDTIFSPAFHPYFNLSGDPQRAISDHLLQINAEQYTPFDNTLCPTGELRSVAGTSLDFRMPKPLGPVIRAKDCGIPTAKGVDHNFVLNDEAGTAAALWCPESGICLRIETTQPGLQVYTGNDLTLDAAPCGKNGIRYADYSGVALETQHFPNTPNCPDFPSILLRRGAHYHQRTVYALSKEKPI